MQWGDLVRVVGIAHHLHNLDVGSVALSMSTKSTLPGSSTVSTSGGEHPEVVRQELDDSRRET